jgi:hypothetical protein
MVIKYFRASDAAEYLGNAGGINWIRQRVTEYHKRGKFPPADAFAGNAPLWLPETIKKYKQELETKKAPEE